MVKSTPKKLRLIPVTGKYCQVALGGKKYEIWKQLNGVKEVGTPFDYDTAISLLSLQPPVVSLVPEIQDGKFVSVLKESDLLLLKEAQASGQSRISNAFNRAPDAETKSKDDILIETLQQQNALLQATLEKQQESFNATLAGFQNKIDTLTQQVSDMSSKDSKKNK